MAKEALALFGLNADLTLPEVKSNGRLELGMSVLQKSLGETINTARPDWVLVHGDTLTCASAALAAFQHQIKIAHVEAGLRTGDLSSPWPEEGYRKVVAAVADLHFAPTTRAADNLFREGVDKNRVYTVGNTVVDALLQMRQSLHSDAPNLMEIQSWFARLIKNRRPVLVTAHRRENHDGGLAQIAEAIRCLAKKYRQNCFIFPVHPNPTVSKVFRSLLSSIENVHLIEPLDYRRFVFVMERAHLILTDSGGIQEEAPSFGTPVLVMRDHTERPEAIEAGTARLVGSASTEIIKNASEIIDSTEQMQRMSTADNPFGDGRASQRILDVLTGHGAELSHANG